MSNTIKLNLYTLKDTSRESLKKHGWYYSTKYSNTEDSYFTYTFPVYKSDQGITLLECELIVNQNNHNVDVEVRDMNDNPYPPFYDDTYSSNNLVLVQVEDNIKKKMRRLGIKREYKNK